MSCILTPDFFQRIDLLELEQALSVPIRIAWLGLCSMADQDNFVPWDPDYLKKTILPFENANFGIILSELSNKHYLEEWWVNDTKYAKLLAISKQEKYINDPSLEEKTLHQNKGAYRFDRTNLNLAPNDDMADSPKWQPQGSKGVLSGNNCPVHRIIDLYHEYCPSLAMVRSFKSGEPHLKRRWKENKEYRSLDWWITLFKYIEGNSFLSGRETRWKANLGWIVRRTNFEKILNGTYGANEKQAFSMRDLKNLVAGQCFLEEI